MTDVFELTLTIKAAIDNGFSPLEHAADIASTVERLFSEASVGLVSMKIASHDNMSTKTEISARKSR